MVAETDRLRLREFSRRDLGALAAMAAKTTDEAEAWIGRNLELYAQLGYGFWLAELRAGADFAGYCGIRPLTLDGAEETEIGWHVHSSLRNQGIATEAAAAVRDLAFGRFGLRRLVARIRDDNLASRRVALKLGMGEEPQVVIDGDPYAIYSIDTMSTTNTSVSFGPIAGGKPCAP